MASTSTHDRIVVGVDGSEASMYALDWAAAAAGRHRLPLYVVHAVELPGLRARFTQEDLESSQSAVVQAARELLDGAVRYLNETWPTIPAEHALEVGTPTQVLLRESEHARQLVVGSRGRGGFASLVLGSVSSAVAEHAECPVIIVRPPARPPGEDREGRFADTVVVGVDGSPTSLSAVEFAFQEASFLEARLTVLHASWDPWLESSAAVSLLSHEDRVTMSEEEQVAVAETLAGMGERFPDVKVREITVNRRPAEALIDASIGAKLVVVGARGLGGFAGMLLGSVSRTVLQHAYCPVAIVRRHAQQSG